MIRKLTIKNFKRFSSESFELADSFVLAGPNNAGKSTALQAIATRRLGLDHWIRHRRGSKARLRTGVPLSRSELTAVPLRAGPWIAEVGHVGISPHSERQASSGAGS